MHKLVVSVYPLRGEVISFEMLSNLSYGLTARCMYHFALFYETPNCG